MAVGTRAVPGLCSIRGYSSGGTGRGRGVPHLVGSADGGGGRGRYPDEALEMLDRVVRDCGHPQPNRHAVPARFACGYDLLVAPSAGTVEDWLAVVGY
jgi:hypothetical protein